MRLLLAAALALDPEIAADVVASGADALDPARRGRYDAIVLDGLMSGMDGIETCRRLKADPATASLPVIFLTALTSDVDRQQFAEVGAMGFVRKPFDPFTLAVELRALLGR